MDDDDQEPSEFSNEDLSAILSEDDLRQRSQALHDAQEVWEDLSYLATPMIPCRECGGRGEMPAGSFGDIECPLCHGRRVVPRPGADAVQMPPFAQLRAAITAYGDALADRSMPAQLPSGRAHPGKRHLALPPASSVPTLEQIKEIHAQGITTARQLQAPAPVDPKLLGTRKRRRDDDDDSGDFSDAELDAQQDEDGDDEEHDRG